MVGDIYIYTRVLKCLKMSRNFFLSGLFILFAFPLQSQNCEDILNLLLANKTITRQQADSIRSLAASKLTASSSTNKSFWASALKQINISGYMQMRYQAYQESGKISSFDIRRAGIDIKGSITRNINYRFQSEFALSPKLLDAYAELRLKDYFNLMAGQFKIPFSLENLTSSTTMESIDRSQAVEALVYRGKDVMGNQNGRDIGVQASGNLLKINDRPFVHYRLGLFNGNGINRVDSATNSKLLVGRLVIHPLPGLDIGGSYLNGHEYYTPDPKVLPKANYNLVRYDFEISFDYNAFSLRGEYLAGKDGELSRTGYYVQAGYYLIPKKLEVLGKVDSYDKKRSDTGDRSDWYCLLVNYNFDPLTRLQAGYYLKHEETNEVRNNLTVIQFQCGF